MVTPRQGGGRLGHGHGAGLLEDQRRDGETGGRVRAGTGLRRADGLHPDGIALLLERGGADRGQEEGGAEDLPRGPEALPLGGGPESTAGHRGTPRPGGAP